MRKMRQTMRRACGLACVAGGLAIVASVGVPAFGAGGTTTASANVNNTLTLSGLTSSFAITGDPSTTQTSTGAVSMNVKTNNKAGYNVTVQSASASMAGAAVGNTDTIPIANLKAKDAGGASYAALSDSSALTLENATARSAGTGDTVTNDYQLDIPFVNADTYSVTLNYTVSAN